MVSNIGLDPNKKCEKADCKAPTIGKEYKECIVYKCTKCKCVLTVPIKIIRSNN